MMRRAYLSWLTTLWALVVGCCLVVGCSDEVPVTHPCVGDACPPVDAGQTVDGNVGNDAEVTCTPVISFYVETKSGNVLQDATTFAKISVTDDLDSDTPGTQVNVVLSTVCLADGSALEVSLDGVAVGTATVAGNAARLDKVTIGCSTVQKSLVVSGGGAQAGKAIQLDCAANACKAALVAPAGCLTTDADPQTPGFQANFTVTTETPDCTDAYIAFTDADGKTGESKKVSLAGGSSVSIAVTLASSDAGLDGKQASVQAFVVDTGNVGRDSQPSDKLTVKLQTEAPVATISQPAAGKLTLKDDANPNQPGIQFTLVGQVSTLTTADTDAIELSVDSTPVAKTTLLVDGTFQFNVDLLTTGAHTIKVSATNGCGLKGDKSQVYLAFVDKASLSITTPTAGAVLPAIADGNPATEFAYETTATVALQNPTKDSTISLYCRKDGAGSTFGANPVGQAVVADPNVLSIDVPVTLDTALLGAKVVCRAQDDAPNSATSADVAFVAALPAPCVQWLLPAGDVTVTSPSLDVLVSTQHLDGIDVVAQLTAATGQQFELQTLGKGGKTPLAGKVLLQTGEPAAKLPDGTYTLSLDATDAFGNHAAVSLCSDATRTITLDTTGPVLAIAKPDKSTLNTFDDGDSDPVKPGFQVDVNVTVADTAELCLVVSGVKIGCKAVAADATSVTFAGVTLQPGANTLEVSGEDVNGNKTVLAPFAVKLVSEAPAVKFVKPQLATVNTASDAFSFEVLVTDADGKGVVGAATEVLLDGVVAPTVAVTDLGGGLYGFVVTNLSKGTTVVQFGAAAASAADKKGYSAEVTVNFKATKPEVTLTSPLDGAVLNAASNLCLLGLKPCVTTVTADAVNLENDATATVTVTCGKAAPQTLPGDMVNGKITFKSVELADQATCTLVASVVDLAGQEATSTTVTVVVDRTPPKLLTLASPLSPGSELQLVATSDFDGDPTNGMQVGIVLNVSGLSTGSKVQLDAFDDDGKKALSTVCTVTTTIGDDQIGKVDCGLQSLPDGYKVKLLFTAADQAGNSATLAVSGQVLSSKALLNINTPAAMPTAPCTSASQCGGGVCLQGACVNAWNKLSSRSMTFTAFGVPNGGLLRLCSNAPGLTGEPCAAGNGYKVVATATVVSQLAALKPETLPDGLYTFIAEASFLPVVPWTNSLETGTTGKSRTVVIDTVAPTLTALQAPTATGVPASCLSDKLQDQADLGQPGGKFTFSATMDEEGMVVLQADKLEAAKLNTTAKSAKLAVNLATEGTVTFTAVPVDIAGNIGQAAANVGPLTLTVNTVAPTGSFAQPSKAKLLATDSLDVKLVSASADVEGQLATLNDSGAPLAAQAAFVSGVALFPQATTNALSDGQHTLSAKLVDVCANQTTISTIPATITVDTKPPVLAWVAPTDNVVLTDADDAAPAGGFQVSAQFGTTDAVSWQLELGADCNATYTACNTTQAVGTGNVTNAGGNEPAVQATLPFGGSAFYAFKLTATDANGNTTTATRGFQVDIQGCIVQLAGVGTVVNTQSCPVKGQNCGSVDQTATVGFFGPCGAVDEVQILKNGAKLLTAAPKGSSATFELKLNDGDKFDIEAVVLAGGAQKGSSGAQGLTVDLSNPVAQFVAASVLGQATLAGSQALVGKSGDLDPATAEHQAHLQVSVADAGLDGGKLVKLQRTVGGNTQDLVAQQPKLPASLAKLAPTVDVQFASLATDATNVVVATVQDGAGNTATASIAVRVDWTPPSEVTLEPLTNINNRRPAVTLQFKAPGEDAGVGTATSYDVRYSRKPIVSELDFQNACPVSGLPATKVAKPQAAGASESITVTGPDGRDPANACKFVPGADNGLTTYYFAVRAVDAAGNTSALTGPSVVSSTKVALRFSKIVLGGALKVTRMQSNVWKVGDLNGDGLGDVALGGTLDTATNTNVPLCILYGHAGLADGTLPDYDLSQLQGPHHVCLTSTAPIGAPAVGVRDVNGDGIDDLAIGALTGAGVPRELRVFLGKKDAVLSGVAALTVKGIYNAATTGVFRINTAGNFNGDTAPNGKPLYDIAFSNRTATGSPVTFDRVHVIPGNASWGESAPLTIDLGSATDRAKNNVLTLRSTDATAVALFGSNMRSVGNVLPDAGPVQYDDLAISQTSGPQQLFVIKGRPLIGDTTLQFQSVCCGNTADEQTAVRLAPDLSSLTGPNNFGQTVTTVEFDGEPTPDLVIQHQSNSVGAPQGGLYWVRGKSLVGFLGKSLPLNSTLLQGQSSVYSTSVGFMIRRWHFGLMAIGNFFDQPNGAIDLAMGRNNKAPDPGSNTLTLIGNFLRPGTAIPTEQSFLFGDMEFGDPSKPGGTNWAVVPDTGWSGVAMAPLEDFNGDGRPDLAVGSLDGGLFMVY
jgi:hypothetical protein